MALNYYQGAHFIWLYTTIFLMVSKAGQHPRADKKEVRRNGKLCPWLSGTASVGPGGSYAFQLAPL